MKIVKGPIRTLKSSTESNLRTEVGPSHPLIPWIVEHAAQFKKQVNGGCRWQNSDREAERPRSSAVQCTSWARESRSHFLLLPAEETLAQGSTLGFIWIADFWTARRTLEHSQE